MLGQANSNAGSSETERFRLPKIEFQANSNQLNTLKQRMLAHYYDQQIQSKSVRKTRDQSTATTYKTSNPQSVGPSYMDLNTMQAMQQKQHKVMLAQDYQKQMARQYSQRKLQRQTKLNQERRMIQNLAQTNKIEQQKDRESHLAYRREVMLQLEAERGKKMKQMFERNREKQQYRRKFISQGPSMQRNASFKDNNKLNKFKEHFDHVNKVQHEIQKNYVHNWSPLIKNREYEKQRLVQAGIFNVHQFQKQISAKNAISQQQYRQQLKHALEQQIKQKQEGRNLMKIRNKSQSYAPEDYRNCHHPIINPVDFKMAHDNKNILRQLKQEQRQERDDDGSSRQSRMARNGSLVVLGQYSRN